MNQKTLYTILVTIFFLSGCVSDSKSESSSANSPLIGSWLEENSDPDARKDQIWTFRSDGTFTSERFYKEEPMTVSAFYHEGTYTANGNNITLNFLEGWEYSGTWSEDGSDTPDAYPNISVLNYSIANDILTFEMDEKKSYRRTTERIRSNPIY